jgi:ABC-type Zn uptake system ZnuABC Zn-binding protein ZnuA
MRGRYIVGVSAWLLLVACTNVPARTQPLSVVATISPLADWTRKVGGDRVVVEVIVPVGVDPQAYEPSEQQRQQIKAADVVFLNGLGLEPWIDEILGESRSGQIVVESSQFVDPPEAPEPDPTPTSPRGDSPQTTPTIMRTSRAPLDQETSRYLWLNPRSAITQVEMIARALTRADAAGFPVYRQNAARYGADLENLDTRFNREVATWPQSVIFATDMFLYPLTQRFKMPLKVVDEDASASSPTGPVFVNRYQAESTAATPLPPRAVVLDPLGGANYEELMLTLIVSMTDAMVQNERGSSE